MDGDRLDWGDFIPLFYLLKQCDDSGRYDLLSDACDIGDREELFQYVISTQENIFPDSGNWIYCERRYHSMIPCTSPALQQYLHFAYWHSAKNGLRHQQNPYLVDLRHYLDWAIGESWRCGYELIIKPSLARCRLFITYDDEFTQATELAHRMLLVWQWFEEKAQALNLPCSRKEGTISVRN